MQTNSDIKVIDYGGQVKRNAAEQQTGREIPSSYLYTVPQTTHHSIGDSRIEITANCWVQGIVGIKQYLVEQAVSTCRDLLNYETDNWMKG